MASGTEPNLLPREQIEAALARLESSAEFTTSPKLCRFLRYVVQQALLGDIERLKEYSIALSVFDRNASFDQRLDSIVRVQARRLRQALDSYYRGAGREEPLRIELPVGGYRPVFQWREPSAPVPEPAPRRRHLPRWLKPAGIAVVLGAVVWMIVGARLRLPSPETASLDGTRLVVRDSRGGELWEKRFPAVARGFAAEVLDGIVVEDLDGDGRKEVLFSYMPPTATDPSSVIYCYRPDGEVLWRRPFGSPRQFGARRFDGAHMGRCLRIVRLGGKTRILTVSNHHLWYPSRAALLDPASGDALEEYWHPGRIYYVVIRDLDNDGLPEAVFAAINNPGEGLGHAALGVLSLPFSRTPAPRIDPGDPLAPVSGGGELAYRLFPLPEVSRALGYLPIPAGLHIDGHDRIQVLIPYPENGAVAYTFDLRLNQLEHRVSDNYAALHERLYRQKLIREPASPATFARLGRVVAFASAPDGNSPAVHRLWRD